jgi:MarR family transcriptional regulator, organic hydroperoxide resistance regulator
MPHRRPRLFHLMSLAQHRLLKAVDATYKETLGITSTQLGVLFILEKSPGAFLKEVSEELGINASAITALIARMEDAGLVRRQGSAEDGRAVHLFATAQGLAKVATAKPILTRLNTRLTHDFSARDMGAIVRFLNAILERF